MNTRLDSIGQASIRGPLALAVVVCGGVLAINSFLYTDQFGSDAMVTSLYDATKYNEIGSALWSGSEPPAGGVSLRGYAYPMLASGLVAQSPYLLFLVQTLAVAVGVFLLARLEQNQSGRLRYVWLCPLFLSLLLAPAIMMTESLGFLAGAASMFAYVVLRRADLGSAVLVLAALIKPAFLPVAILSLASVPIGKRLFAVLALLVVTFGSQLWISERIDGKATTSSAGSFNFTERFFPAVYGTVHGLGFVNYRSHEAEKAKEAYRTTGEQVQFVLGHPLELVQTWWFLMADSHLAKSSGYPKSNAAADPENAKILLGASRTLNTLLLLPALAGAIGSIAFLFKNSWRLWPAVLIAPCLIATAPLVYWQGDRVVFIALLFLLPFVPRVRTGRALNALNSDYHQT